MFKKTLLYKGSFNRYVMLDGGEGKGFCYEALWKLVGGGFSDTIM